MQRILILICLLMSLSISSAQTQDLQSEVPSSFFKDIPTDISSLPHWAQMMYSRKFNVIELQKLYEEYYDNNKFEKTIHTQNYKFLMKRLYQDNCFDEFGNLQFTTKELHDALKKSESPLSDQKWSLIGPMETYHKQTAIPKTSQVNVYCLTQSLRNPNLLVCGTETGFVFKTTDKGVNWSNIGGFDIENTDIQAIEIDPNNDDIIYVGGSNKLYRTSDGGSTWELLLSQNNMRIVVMYINPTNNDIFIGNAEGLKKSTDSGKTWSLVVPGFCYDIVAAVGMPNVIYAACNNSQKNIIEIHKSTNGGISFSAKTNGWFEPEGGVANKSSGAKIGTTNADPKRLYVVLLGNEKDYATDNNYIGIYRSDDGGESWYLPYDQNLDGMPNNNPGGPYNQDHWCLSSFGITNVGYDQGFFNLGIGVSDSDPDRFFAGFLNLFRSTNGGATYQGFGGYYCDNCGSHYSHPDIQDIVVNGDDVWVATDGGIDLYDKDFNFIESRKKGIWGSDFWGFGQGWNEDVVTGGRYHNGNSSYMPNYQDGRFLSLGGAEAASGYVNQGENRKVYHSDISAVELPDSLTGKTTGAPNYGMFPNESYVFQNKSEVVTHPNYYNILFLGKDNKLWKSVNGGPSFDMVYDFGESVRGIEISRKNPDVMFVSTVTSNKLAMLYKTEDAGSSWTKINLPVSTGNMFLSLNENDVLFIALFRGGNDANKVFKSTNYGAEWQNLTSPMLDNQTPYYIQAQLGTDDGVYLASNSKIYYRNKVMNDWVNLNEGLPVNYRIMSLIPFYKNGVLRIAGNGGIWERDLYEASQIVPNPTVSHHKVYCSKDEIQFEDYSAINHDDVNWSWEFPGAVYVSNPNIRNPIVRYGEIGVYDVKLTIIDKNGTKYSKEMKNMVEFVENLCAPSPEAKNAIKLETNNQYLELNKDIFEDSVSNFTFTGWIKPNGIQADYSSIFSLGDGESVNKNCFNFTGEKNNTLGYHWNGGDWWIDTGLEVPEDEWSFVAIAVEPTKITLYLNEKKWEKTGLNLKPFVIDRIILGSYYGWSSRNFNGLFDEFTFWKRTLSEDEIYQSRHLTKKDLSDESLFAYFQFNDSPNQRIYDLASDRSMEITGNAILTESTAPIGRGVSQMINQSDEGVLDFDKTGLSLVFQDFGIPPIGKYVVSKLENKPSGSPDLRSINKFWIINYYGGVESYESPNNIIFSDLSEVEGREPSELLINQRASNSYLSSEWSNSVEAKSINSNKVSFETKVNFGQICLTYSNSATSEEPDDNKQIYAYPNPLVEGNTLNFKNLNEISQFELFDFEGKRVISKILNLGDSMIFKDLAEGVYFYRITNTTKIYTGKLIIK